MHCNYGTNSRVPQWTVMDPWKTDVGPGTREETTSPACLVVPEDCPTQKTGTNKCSILLLLILS